MFEEFGLNDEIDIAPDVPHVVMMAGNNFLVDTRALKSAVSVAQWKLQVTAIGLAERGIRESDRSATCGCPLRSRPVPW